MLSHITMVATLPPVKGVSDYCLNQIPELQKKVGVDFYNFSDIYPEFLYPGGTKEDDPIFKMKPTPRAKIHTTLTWYNPFSWIEAGMNSKGEILHFHWWTFYLFHVFFTIALIARLRGKKVICTVHNVKSNPWGLREKIIGLGEGIFTWLVFSQVNGFIVHSKRSQEQLQETFHISSDKVTIIPHGNYDFYNDKPITQSEARKKLKIPKKAKAILSFGNLRPYKGYQELIDAFKEARKKTPELYLIIAGKPWKADDRTRIQESLNGIPNVLLEFDYIPSSEIKYYFQSADLVVLPYREFSGQSGPGNIALAFGKPLLVSNVGGLPDLVLQKEAVIPPHNTEALTRALLHVFQKSGVLLQWSKDALLLKKKYAWDALTDQTISFYQKILSD